MEKFSDIRHGANLIKDERERQIKKEGWDAKHDDYYEFEELAKAAACYAIPPKCRQLTGKLHVPTLWPWDDESWNPDTENRIRELVKAGALIAAEIDRLFREKEKFGVTMNKISNFEGEYRFLSNFFLAPITYDGRVWPSSEHLYEVF